MPKFTLVFSAVGVGAEGQTYGRTSGLVHVNVEADDEKDALKRLGEGLSHVIAAERTTTVRLDAQGNVPSTGPLDPPPKSAWDRLPGKVTEARRLARQWLNANTINTEEREDSLTGLVTGLLERPR